MKPLPHHYEVELSGSAASYGFVSSRGLPRLRAAAPPEYGGPGDAWSPEHLLLAAVETCFLFTFRAVAHAARLPFESLTVVTGGTVDRKAGVTRFTEIVLRPTLTVPAGTDAAAAMRALEKAERACLVSASLATPLRMEPQIEYAETPDPAWAATAP